MGTLGPLPPDLPLALDRGYDSRRTRTSLDHLALIGHSARPPAEGSVPLGERRVVERTHDWVNGFGKVRRCTERAGVVADFYLWLAAAIVTVRLLISRARETFCWPTRPTTRRMP
jgi:hypothetical protein